MKALMIIAVLIALGCLVWHCSKARERVNRWIERAENEAEKERRAE